MLSAQTRGRPLKSRNSIQAADLDGELHPMATKQYSADSAAVFPLLSHYFSKKQKVEGGIDYRTDRFSDDGLRQRFWFKVGWFVNI